MSTNYDGKSRPSNDKYRNNYNDIFGKKKVDKKVNKSKTNKTTNNKGK